MALTGISKTVGLLIKNHKRTSLTMCEQEESSVCWRPHSHWYPPMADDGAGWCLPHATCLSIVPSPDCRAEDWSFASWLWLKLCMLEDCSRSLSGHTAWARGETSKARIGIKQT